MLIHVYIGGAVATLVGGILLVPPCEEHFRSWLFAAIITTLVWPVFVLWCVLMGVSNWWALRKVRDVTISDYIRVVADRLDKAKDANDKDEVIRLLRMLRDTCDEKVIDLVK